MLIVLEGLDGSGKSYLDKQLGYPIQKFPDRDTPVGQKIDFQLRNGVEDPMVFQSLMLTNRYERYGILTEHEYSDKHLLLERYWQSGWVYGQMDGISRRWLEEIHRGLPETGLNFFLDTPLGLIADRRKQRGSYPEFYEQQEKDKRARDLYLELWYMHGGDWIVLPYDYSMSDLQHRIQLSTTPQHQVS